MTIGTPVLIAVIIAAALPALAKDAAGVKRLEKSLRKPAALLAYRLEGKVCVMDFADLSDANYTSEFGQKVADLLSNHLVNTRRTAFTLVERRDLLLIVQDSLLMVGDDADAIEKLKRQAGMDVLVTGSYSAAGDGVSLHIKAVTTTGRLLASATANIKKTPGIDQMISRRLRRDSAQESPPVSQEIAPRADPSTNGTATGQGEADVLELETGAFYEGGDGRIYPLREGMVLNSRDNYAIYLKAKKPCYVYVYQVDSSRKAFKVFPNPEISSTVNPLQEGREHWIPNEKEFLYLDDNPGREELYVFATRLPSPTLENIREAKFSEISQAIRTMGLAGKRGAISVSKVKDSEGNAMELVMRKLAAQGDFFYKTFFIHQ